MASKSDPINGNPYIAQIVNKIKEIRIEKGYSQSDIGEMLGMSQNAYSKIELNQTRLTVAHLIIINDILETSFETLLLKEQ